MKESMKLEDALPLIEATLATGASFRFYAHGTSMLPMIRQDIDSVSLVSPSVREPVRGEVILYRRKNGSFVLHRIIKKDKKGKFSCRGDNQIIIEHGVSPESIIGVLDGYYREDNWISADDAMYKRYVKRRMNSVWFRYLKVTLKNIIIK